MLPLTIPLPCRMCVSNPLSVKHFHGVSAGNAHGCSLKPSIGRAREVHRGVDHTRASVGWWHRLGSHRRQPLGMVGVVCTRGAMRALRESLEGFGVGGAFALTLEGHGFGW